MTNAVLVTRPQPGADATADRLRALGIAAVVAPMLRVRARPLVQPPAVQAVLVTSGQALPSLMAASVRGPVLAVGDATAARARALGLAPVHSAAGDAADLAGLAGRLLERGGAPLLLACGRGQGGALAAALRADGFRVLRRVAYAAEPVRRLPPPAAAALEGGALRAALFLSAETARAFGRALPAGLVPALATVEALAIGAAAAAALHGLPWRRVRVAARPTEDGVLALL